MIVTFSDFYNVAMLSAAAVWAVVAVLVLRSRNKRLYARIWAGASLLVAATWAGMHLVTHVVESRSAALTLTKVVFSTGPGACLGFFCFGLAFLDRLRAWRRVVQVSLGLAALTVVLAWTTKLLFTGLRDYGLGLRMPEAGPLMPVYACVAVFWLFTPAVLFFRAWRRERGRTRLQLGYLSSALVLMALFGVGSLAPTMGAARRPGAGAHAGHGAGADHRHLRHHPAPALGHPHRRPQDRALDRRLVADPRAGLAGAALLAAVHLAPDRDRLALPLAAGPAGSSSDSTSG